MDKNILVSVGAISALIAAGAAVMILVRNRSFYDGLSALISTIPYPPVE